MLPAPKVIPSGERPRVRIRATTRFVSGSTRMTRSSTESVVQSDPAAATANSARSPTCTFTGSVAAPATEHAVATTAPTSTERLSRVATAFSKVPQHCRNGTRRTRHDPPRRLPDEPAPGAPDRCSARGNRAAAGGLPDVRARRSGRAVDADGAGRTDGDAAVDGALPPAAARTTRSRRAPAASGGPAVVPRPADGRRPTAARRRKAPLSRLRGGGRGRARGAAHRDASARPRAVAAGDRGRAG